MMGQNCYHTYNKQPCDFTFNKFIIFVSIYESLKRQRNFLSSLHFVGSLSELANVPVFLN